MHTHATTSDERATAGPLTGSGGTQSSPNIHYETLHLCDARDGAGHMEHFVFCVCVCVCLIVCHMNAHMYLMVYGT